jgi:hypothetical protein
MLTISIQFCVVARWEAHKLKADDISTPGKGRRARAAKQTTPFGKADCHDSSLLSQKPSLCRVRGQGKEREENRVGEEGIS